MDNSQGSGIAREVLMKVLIGDEVGYAMKTTLLQFGMIRKRKDIKKRVGIDAWVEEPISDYELTEKGLERLNGLQK